MAKTFEILATATLGSSVTSYTFSSISSSYTDLVVISTPILQNSGNYTAYYNSVTTSYYWHRWLNSFTPGFTHASNEPSFVLGNLNAGKPGMVISNFHQYKNTNINKVTMSEFGSNDGTTARFGVTGGTSSNTSAISSLTFYSTAGNLEAGSKITIYGILAGNA